MGNEFQGWDVNVGWPVYQPPPPPPRPYVIEGPNHALHFVLTLLTAGLWLPVWLIIAIDNRKKIRYL
jgi:hypothetical protein